MLGDDLTPFFNVGEFATLATVGAKSFPVIFDEQFDAVTMRSMFDYTQERAGLKAEAHQITATCKTSDLGGVHQQDAISIKGRNFKIIRIYPVQDGLVSVLEMSE